MKAEQAAALLDADALLPVKQKIKTRAEIDTISARAYAHPALPGKVVRLTADPLAQGDDLAMEFLGFESPDVTGPVAQRKRQALGFPGWALINDPEHARYALELVKEFRKEIRRAKAKPGHGYDGIQAIAKKLNRSVAHFLPSFWEEAGRTFIEFGNASYASRCFGKAREAEKVHALKVDEDIRRNAFLEFALAGCLSIKALTEYSKELEAAYGAEEAWTIYRELIVRRTLGGMPPWAAMAKDVKRVAKAAKLDYEEILKDVLREIIDSPAMVRAETSFWTNCGKVIKDLAHEEAAVAKALLTLIPETSYWRTDQVWEWLELLDQWELLPIIYGEGNQDAKPDGSTAAWVQKYCEAAGRGGVDQRLHDLMPKVAEQLKNEGEPLSPYMKRWSQARCDLDLLDLILELKIPLADPPKFLNFDLGEWAEVAEEDDCPENRPRDPLFVANDERFAETLKASVANVAGASAFEAAATGKEALREARREWIMNLASAASAAGLPGADSAVESLQRSTSRKTFREFPEAYEQLKQASVANALANTLQVGILDEYGWPALEEAADKLAPESKKDLRFYGRLPYAIVTNGLNFVVVDRDQAIMEGELNIPKNHEFRMLDYYDGDVYVQLRDEAKYESYGYWISNPSKTFEAGWSYRDPVPNGAIAVRPEGGWFNGEQTVTAGDAKKIESGEKFFSDGEHYWSIFYENGYTETVLREIDPANGKKGRKSMPAFLEDFLKDGHEIDFRNSALVRVGDVVNESPLGSKDGLIGWRVLQHDNSWVRAEGVDGRGVDAPIGPAEPGALPHALLDQPGTDNKIIVSGDNGWHSPYRQDVTLWHPDGSFPTCEMSDTGTSYHQGQATLLLPLFWHLFQVRDLKSSKKLRKIKEKDAEKLITAARADLDVTLETGDTGTPKLDEAIVKLLPGCHERLARGIQGIVVRAARCKTELNNLIESRDPEGEDEVSFDASEVEAFLDDAVRELRVGYSWGSLDSFLPCVEQTAKFFAGDYKASNDPPRVSFWWWQVLNGLNTKVWQAYWSSDETYDDPAKLKQAAWVRFLELWRTSKINELPGRMRGLTGKLHKDPPFAVPEESDFCELWKYYEHESSRYLFHCDDLDDVYEDDVYVIEYTEADEFVAPPKYSITAESLFRESWSAEQLEELIPLITEREPPYLAEDQLERLAAGVGVPIAEAAMVWSAFPNFSSWEKNFLPKPLRERLGLKVAEAQTARLSLQAIDGDIRVNLLGAMLDGPPSDLWDNQAAVVDRLIAAWSHVVPTRLELPGPIMDQLDNLSGWGVDVGEIMTSLADPDNAPQFSNGKSRLNADRYYVQVKNEPEESFDENALILAVGAIPTLYYCLPVGDPAREAAVKVYDVSIDRCKNEDLILGIGTRHFAENKKNPPGPAFLGQFGKLTKGETRNELDNGPLMGMADDDSAYVAFRPSKATTAKSLDRVRSAVGMMMDDRSDYDPINDNLDHFLLLRGDGYKEIVKRLKKTPLKDGQYETNPLHSAPEIVKKTIKKYDLGEDAAVLYLQTLTLFDCTTKNVREWNDWTAAKYNKAAKELAEAKLLLEAKRARAGRKHFLPGGWEALKAPHLPLESWKLPMYQVVMASSGVAEFPLDRIVCLKPVHMLFEDAWNRVESGDEPKYEEVE